MPAYRQRGYVVTELRSSVRFPIKLPISVRNEAETRKPSAEPENISAGGVLFYADADLAEGSTIEFRIMMPGSVLGTNSDVLVFCTGRVVRCTIEGERRKIAAVIDEYRFERSAAAFQ